MTVDFGRDGGIELTDWLVEAREVVGEAPVYRPPSWVLASWSSFWGLVDKTVDRAREFRGLAAHQMCWLWTGEISDRFPRFWANRGWVPIWTYAWRSFYPACGPYPRPRVRCPDLCVRPTHLQAQALRARRQTPSPADRDRLRQMVETHPPEVVADRFELSVHRVLELARPPR